MLRSGLVIVRNLNLVGIMISPHKANAVLAVDAYAALPLAVSAQLLEVISRRRAEIGEFFGGIQHEEFPLGNGFWRRT
jgi:hypothetical protein